MTRRKPMTLAARVAAEVMRWEVCRDAKCEGCNAQVIWSGRVWCVHKPGHWTLDGEPIRWDPVANPADLMDVLGELRRRGLGTRIDLDADQVYVEVTDSYGNLLGVESLAPTGRNTWQLCLARAVCRAALEAVKEAGGSDA